MTDNERSRRAILARRARFLAAALATLPTAACDREKEAIQPDHPRIGAAPDAAFDSTTTAATQSEDAGVDATKPTPEPMPCLKVAPPRDAGMPHPCLKKAISDDDY